LFLSWSGPVSRRVACALRDWLPTVLPYAKPWVSSEDIDKGSLWLLELRRELESAAFGIICLTPSNIGEPWVLFEAGSMAHKLESSRVSPFLVGLGPSALTGSPLAQFQCTEATKEDLERLLLSINKVAPSPIEDSRLKSNFTNCWRRFEESLQTLTTEASKSSPVESASTPNPPELSEGHIKVLTELAKLSSNQRLNALTIAHLLDVSEQKARFFIDGLLQEKYIFRVLDDPAGYYLAPRGRDALVEKGLL